jgi:hypothetical protein
MATVTRTRGRALSFQSAPSCASHRLGHISTGTSAVDDASTQGTRSTMATEGEPAAALPPGLVGERQSLASAQPGTEVADALAELWRSGYVCVAFTLELDPAPPNPDR